MRTKQSESKPATRVVDPRPKDNSMQEIWDQAAQEFEQICGKSLQNGEVKSFDDVQRAIEESGKASYRAEPEDKWDKAKSVGLLSLKYLKVLVGAASQASSFVCWRAVSFAPPPFWSFRVNSIWAHECMCVDDSFDI